ncbi:uncharacterized protein J3R85_006074 [Psidium guajava]|nr:uncharacterized protein J3R85_006074 [Psidium guajava]
MPFATPRNRYAFVGSYNGLICVEEMYSKHKAAYLWNIFTRKHKAVQRSDPEHQFFYMGTSHIVLGFGFDARSNDYKIVRILYLSDSKYRFVSGIKPRVEIYSLGADSWRSLECEVPAFCGYRPAVFLNGNLHWSAFEFDDLRDEGGHRLIVSFDIAGEVFDEMALPEEIFHDYLDGSFASVAALNDLLAVVGVVHPEPQSICSVWVMREYGMPESWTKLYTFEGCGLVITAVDGFTRNGELLLEIEDVERLSWNPITGQYTNLPLLTKCNVVSIVESLVSP